MDSSIPPLPHRPIPLHQLFLVGAVVRLDICIATNDALARLWLL